MLPRLVVYPYLYLSRHNLSSTLYFQIQHQYREFQYNHPKCVAACTNNHLKSCKGNGCSNEEEKGAHNHQDEDQSKIQNFNLLMPNKKQTKRKDTNTTTKSSPPVVQTPSRKSSRLLEASLCLPTSEDTMDASEEEEHGAGGSESDGEYDEETEEEEDESNKYTSSGKLIKAAARKAKGARNTEYLPRGITLRSTGKWVSRCPVLYIYQYQSFHASHIVALDL